MWQAASEVINQFYMDEVVELLGHYLKHDYAATLALPTRRPAGPYGQPGELNYVSRITQYMDERPWE